MADHGSPPLLLSVRMPTVGVVLCLLPLGAALFCVVWSLVFDFRNSTATQCRVANYLPSLSAAIGDSTPQRYVWRVAVCLHAAPRFLLTLTYRKLHAVHGAVGADAMAARGRYVYDWLVASAALSNMAEVGALVGLSYISSTENHRVHEALFTAFMVSSLLYMALTITLFSWRHRCTRPSGKEFKSLAWKRRLFAANVCTFLVSAYLYFRHNWYCEPGVYTMFAVCEYLGVLTNIGFHGTLAWDLCGLSLAVVSTGPATDHTGQQGTARRVGGDTQGGRMRSSDSKSQ
ncbi:hypothetical protein EGW08_002773 [Elysia chlorotica]|uniref:CWH43-like N-terminal domain-containing protein n=1 Tax=Elysia chlorotica TaxID=188477 RepID=A0A3S1BJ13_ELYCH|nr:hypothetical protein EGW08_002773 [Elysia chlorotica]